MYIKTKRVAVQSPSTPEDLGHGDLSGHAPIPYKAARHGRFLDGKMVIVVATSLARGAAATEFYFAKSR